MHKYYRSLVALLCIIVIVSCGEKKMPDIQIPTGCQLHIELQSAQTMAKEYGKSEMWVLQNVKINIWEKSTPDGKGRPVGKMIPGSRAVILEEGPDDYKVQSPLDKSIGWINKMHVARTLKQDVETREPCN